MRTGPRGRPRPRSRHFRLPIRARLTALYAVLFLACGATMLAITYGLVDQTTRSESLTLVLPDGTGVVVDVDLDAAPPLGEPEATGEGSALSSPGLDPAELRDRAAQQHTQRMLALLGQSAIALGIMTLVSVVLGWIVATRALRPLRAITATTRRITAENLDERLSLDGPRDELTELGDTIDSLLTRLEGSFRAQRIFVANASHELRTPLARQRTVAQVALDDPGATIESLRAAHERVLAAGAQQEQIIDALLTLARGQAGVRSSEPVDLASLVRDCVAHSQSPAKQQNLTLDAKLSPASVVGDPRLIERLIANLLDNAIRYNRPGGSVHISTSTRNGIVELKITNTGDTVPEESVDALLEPFRRLDRVRTSHADGHGYGLGLSIVHAIAEAHRATLDIQPQPGGGLCVSVAWDRGA